MQHVFCHHQIQCSQERVFKREAVLPFTDFSKLFPNQAAVHNEQGQSREEMQITSDKGKGVPWQTRHATPRFLRELALPFSHFHQAHGNQNFSLWQSRNDAAWATGASAPVIPAHGTHLAAQLNQPADKDSSETSADSCCLAAHPPS